MPDGISLLSLVLTLRPLAAGPGPESLARAAHAILLDTVRRADPALAESLHAGSERRPFTVSELLGYSGRYGFSPERAYQLRFTALTAPVANALLANGRFQPGQVLDFDGAPLRVEALDSGQSRAPDPTGAQNPAPENRQAPWPWAAATDYEALSAPWLLGRLQPDRQLSLLFASPTTFKAHGLHHLPVPLPAMVFKGLLEKWNAFAPVALPEETIKFAEECLALSAYSLSTRPALVKEGGLRVGAVGKARYIATHYDRYWMSLIQLLADFALFAGIGAGTPTGLGQCRRLKETERFGKKTRSTEA